MMTHPYLMSDALVRALGWTLVHSLWQGVLVAFVAAILLQLLRYQSPKLRYHVAYAALMTLLLAAVVTFERLYTAEKRLDTEGVSAGVKTASENESIVIQILGNQSFVEKWFGMAYHFLNQYLTAIALFWCIGVFFFGLKLTFGWWLLRGHQRRGGVPLDDHWQNLLRHFQRQLSINPCSIQLLEAAWVQTPLTIGWLRPVIFLPIGILNRLSPTEVEAILAHELAHIAGRDYIFNFLQAIVEVLFYYHPAVWWLSSVVRNEREMRCDDKAIALCGNNRLAYAKTLVRLQEQFDASTAAVPQLALAFGKRPSFLFRRVQRLFPSPNKQSEIMHKMMITGLLLCVTLLFAFAKNSVNTEGSVFAKIENTLSAEAKKTANQAVSPTDLSVPKANLAETPKLPTGLKTPKEAVILLEKADISPETVADTTKKPQWVNVKDTMKMVNGDVPPQAQPGHCYAKCQLPSGGFGEWLEIVCNEKVTPTFIRSLTAKLTAEGFLSNTIVGTETVSKPLRDAIVAYQRKHNLPVGNLNMPTMEHMGIQLE